MKQNNSSTSVDTPRKTTAKAPPTAAPVESADLQANELRALSVGGEVAAGQVQAKPASKSAGLQAKELKALTGASVGGLTDSLTAMAVQAKSGGEPVNGTVRSRVEPAVGADLSGVRVHSDPLSQLAAANLGARAFTHGRDIYLGAGESTSDIQLMAHELTHVAQQGNRDRTPVQRLTAASPHGKAEREADTVAQRVAEGGAAAHAPMVSTPDSAQADNAVQCILIANGDRQGFVDLTNGYLEGIIEISVDGNGVTSIAATDSENLPSDMTLFQTLVNVLIALIADGNKTILTFTHGKTTQDPKAKQVLVGSYVLAMIDLDDLIATGSGEGVSGASMLIHEMHEQWRKQVHGDIYDLAHGSAVKVEEAAVGCTRGAATMKQIDAETIEATVPFTYPNGKVVSVKMTIKNNNIIAVERTVTKEAD